MRIKPDYILESIYDIDKNELKSKGIKGIFFDLDSTVMQSKTGKFTKKTLDFLEDLKQDFKVAIIFSVFSLFLESRLISGKR